MCQVGAMVNNLLRAGWGGGDAVRCNCAGVIAAVQVAFAVARLQRSTALQMRFCAHLRFALQQIPTPRECELQSCALQCAHCNCVEVIAAGVVSNNYG